MWLRRSASNSKYINCPNILTYIYFIAGSIAPEDKECLINKFYHDHNQEIMQILVIKINKYLT